MRKLKCIALLIMTIFIVGIANPASASAQGIKDLGECGTLVSPTNLSPKESCYIPYSIVNPSNVNISLKGNPVQPDTDPANVVINTKLTNVETEPANFENSVLGCHQPNVIVYPGVRTVINCSSPGPGKMITVTNDSNYENPTIVLTSYLFF